MTHLLIDSDSLLYKAGFVANGPEQEALATYQLDVIIENILSHVQPESHQFFISGEGNFRYNIYPNYKGNRVGMARPLHLGALREHIVVRHGATVSSGWDADDSVSMLQWNTEDTCIAGIDKDLDLIPGRHFNYNKYDFYEISDVEAYRNFYIQLIQGDKGDNVPGFDGKMRPKLPKFLYGVVQSIKDCDWPEMMFDIVLGMYQYNYRKLDTSARCLWLLRNEDDDWTKWLNESTLEEIGLSEDFQALLQARSEPLVDDGL